LLCTTYVFMSKPSRVNQIVTAEKLCCLKGLTTMSVLVDRKKRWWRLPETWKGFKLEFGCFHNGGEGQVYLGQGLLDIVFVWTFEFGN